MAAAGLDRKLGSCGRTAMPTRGGCGRRGVVEEEEVLVREGGAGREEEGGFEVEGRREGVGGALEAEGEGRGDFEVEGR